MSAPTPEPTPEFDEPSEDELYAAALDEASARLDMPHPLSESYIVAARAGVDAALAVSARYAAALPHLPQHVRPSREAVRDAITGGAARKSEAVDRVLALFSSQPTVEDVRRETLVQAAELLAWLVACRADYFHNDGTELDVIIGHEINTGETLARIMREGPDAAVGWLPSWRWDEFSARWLQLHTRAAEAGEGR